MRRADRGGRFFKRKECWVPTAWGWAAVVLVAAVAGLVWILSVHALLAVNEPARGRLLVLEGWVSSTTSLRLAAEEFKAHGYERLVIAEDHERPWVLSLLKRNGVSPEEIVAIPVVAARKDRTYSSAAAVRGWLLASAPGEKAVDVFTIGTHARRSWMLYRKALGPDFRVGIISAPSPWYDPDHWWRSSEGFKEVVYESIACLYTALFFLPFQ